MILRLGHAGRPRAIMRGPAGRTLSLTVKEAVCPPGFPMQWRWSMITGRIGTRRHRSGWIQARPAGVAPVLVMVWIIVITPFRLDRRGRRGDDQPEGAPACAGILSGPPSCRERCGRQARSRSLNGVRLPAYTSGREKCEQSVSECEREMTQIYQNSRQRHPEQREGPALREAKFQVRSSASMPETTIWQIAVRSFYRRIALRRALRIRSG